MSNLKHVIRYFVSNYPYGNELSKTRLTKMVYLADWYSAVKNKRQITNIEWYFNHYGPYVSDVFEAAQNDNKLIIVNTTSAFGSPKEIVALKNEKKISSHKLLDDEIEILDQVILNTKHLTWNSFIDMIYSTYPVKSQMRYEALNLVELAIENSATKE